MADKETGPQVGKIFGALAAVKRHINSIGVEKSKENEKQGYKFRGIDNVMDAFSGILSQSSVLTTPVYGNLQREKITTSGGSGMFVVTVELVLTFLSLEDGSAITVGPFYGEASDSLDKATSKAHSVAYRNAMLLTFTCPLGPEMDPEMAETDREVAAEQPAKDAQAEAAREPLTESQRSQLLKRLEAVGVTPGDFAMQFGVIHAGNYREAMQAAKTATAPQQ